MEVDAVDAVQGGLGVPGAAGPHGADLHADAADGQLGREGEGSDSVATSDPVAGSGPVTTGVAALGPPAASLPHYDRHALFTPFPSFDHCPRFTTG
ncbi:hypothetical protein Srubr_40240 [Streptomyces rubradiris]|uniref:Uncharacterized protein n=1 Tax=Streptomyces rubradiris TaxID=285531 RepID=A0ABQ3RE92_STRRR|nr:hypothetical protein GCM10018792_72940 [Streptomyces rubradiris]GHI54178.1 hypothetical protein Srubr_40240 [Streptomyces rubradiris]